MATISPLTDPSPGGLAEAVPANIYALFRAMTILPGSERVESETLCYHHTFPNSPIFKGIWRSRLTPDTADAAIDQAVAWFRARNAPFALWWIAGPSEPDDLPARLEAHGFAPSNIGSPAMAVDLDSLDDDVPTPDGFRIVSAAEHRHLEDWRVCFSASYDLPPSFAQAWVDATMRSGIARAPWQLYVGYLRKRPVACSILFNGGGVAGVYAVGTVPDARGQGIGSAITLKPLLDAREQGYRFGVLFATEMGAAVYRRLGFRDVDCPISRYVWRNPG